MIMNKEEWLDFLTQLVDEVLYGRLGSWYGYVYSLLNEKYREYADDYKMSEEIFCLIILMEE